MITKKRILFVDDSPTMRRIIANTLNKIGIERYDQAENGLDALEKLHEKKYDLLLTDWNMPEMNGKELIEFIRGQEHLKNLPILMITTRGMEEDVLTAIRAGVNGYIVKPFTPDVLKKKMIEILGI
jgi:two-component system chemotaxis response regulator CheY